MHSIVTTFRWAVIKVEVANFGAAMDTLIDQDAMYVATVDSITKEEQNPALLVLCGIFTLSICLS